MGHERVGKLPKTKKWRDIVQQMAGLEFVGKNYLSESDNEYLEYQISEIARETIKNLRSQLRNFQYDNSIKSAFRFLVCFSMASRNIDPCLGLMEFGIEIPPKPTPLSFAKAIRVWMQKKGDSLEYNSISQSATVDAIALWFSQNESSGNQLSIFSDELDPFEAWRKAGNGAGFCELSRLFFAKFTERYLQYFLEREASSSISDIDQRILFSEKIEKHIDTVSKHAFEVSKITQSFAAGWFNKNAVNSIPSEQAIEGFLGIALGKIRDELLREDEP